MAEAEQPQPVQTAAETEAVPVPEPDTSGWYRNNSAVPLLVQPTGYPSKLLQPDKATWLPADPQHPDLKPCDAPAPEAAAEDTTGSEK